MRLVTDIRGEWPRIKAHLEAALAKCEAEWIPEDVYHALKSGSAACHMDDETLLVTTFHRTEHAGIPTLHAWIGHHATHDPITEGVCELLRDMAKRAGAQRITFSSSRPGWAKRFNLVSATYEVPL